MRAKDLTNEELANILRLICATGICPTSDEIEYMHEAADRLEKGETDGEIMGRQ